MSSLVSDFIINPVLRQARRFSRSGQPSDEIDSTTTTQNLSNEGAIEDLSERLEGLNGQTFTEDFPSRTISGVSLTSSPIEEDVGLDAELELSEHGRRPSAPVSHNARSTEPHRVVSLRSESTYMDFDMSNNPSFGVPGRFRTNSATSSIYGTATLTGMNARMSPAEGPSRRSTQDQGSRVEGRVRQKSLPADDGMGPLRQQILGIQSMGISSIEKAQLMHRLLTRGYNETQEAFIEKNQPAASSPETMISQERPTTPGSLSSFLWQMNGATEAPAPDQEQYTFQLSPNDLEATYAPLEPPEEDDDGEICIRDNEPSLGCRHYKRNVKLQCSTCNRWYTCRLCHDEVEDHILIRKETKNMLCMLCRCAQRASEFCVGCGERTAWYYCGVCKLWDNDSTKSIYHCNDCGICRKGRGIGKDFFHCKTCGTCMSMSVEKSHKCIERVSDCDCPICGDYMFTSPTPVVFMLCGHGIHKSCYDEHMKSSYKCPICSKSTFNMESQFRNLDRAIDSQPMPPEFRDTKAMVACNDCYAKSAVAYHWLGLKCAICDSYNTAQLSILSDPDDEAPNTEIRETETAPAPIETAAIASSSLHVASGLSRQRRHSSHLQPRPGAVQEPSGRFSPYPRPRRIGRSVSPIRGFGYFDEDLMAVAAEAEESVQEDDLDFWGRDEPRSVASADAMREEEDEEDEEDEEESDEDSVMDDCDEDDGDEVDQFELFGHR